MQTDPMKVCGGTSVLYLGAAAVGLIFLVHGCQTMATSMSRDERLYRAKCSSCHQPVAPETRTPDRWHELLQHHGPKLTEAERAAILRYLTPP